MLKKTIQSVAIGGFDGMHIAHQELFKRLGEHGGIVVIESGYANLTPKTNRAEYTGYPLFYYPLENIKHLEAKEFIKLLKQEFPNLKCIVVGFDFRFGARASGNIELLHELFDGEVIVIEEFFCDGEAVHSRVIRDYLSKGNIPKANRYLGKNYKIVGRVITGQGLGKKQFVPTLNLDSEHFLIPSEGIYASYTIIDNKKYLSATFVGHRVTTDGKFAIETHIIDKSIDFFDGRVEIEFIEKIRDNKKYEIYKELQNQILDDIKEIKNKFLV